MSFELNFPSPYLIQIQLQLPTKKNTESVYCTLIQDI